MGFMKLFGVMLKKAPSVSGDLLTKAATSSKAITKAVNTVQDNSKLTNALKCLAAQKVAWIKKSTCIQKYDPLLLEKLVEEAENAALARAKKPRVPVSSLMKGILFDEEIVKPKLDSLLGIKTKPANVGQAFLNALYEDGIRSGLSKEESLAGALCCHSVTGKQSAKVASDSFKFFEEVGLIK